MRIVLWHPPSLHHDKTEMSHDCYSYSRCIVHLPLLITCFILTGLRALGLTQDPRHGRWHLHLGSGSGGREVNASRDFVWLSHALPQQTSGLV